MTMAVDEWPRAAFSPEVQARVASSNVLMVGAGGIGCELVKTLALSGFRKVTMVDMDTIEISNLNRQFLFRKHHVGQSKAEVAAEAVRAFCPYMKITALQDNVKDSKFDLDFIKGFDMVLNGLDNDEARRHVNRLCLATGTPLVESGTMGYRGQVSVHLRDESECYECMPRPKPKGYPVCTIRNTPDKPIHCVVWAKDLLFMRLFGPADAVTDLDEVQEKDGEEKPTDSDASSSEFLRRDSEGSWQYALRIFDKVFHADIQRLLGMDDLWKTHARPSVLELQKLLPDAQPLELPANAMSASKLLQLDPRAMWDTAENARVFLNAIAMFHERRSADVRSLSFDKDDDLAIDFVTAASNLRSHCYGIPLQSKFTVKGMAGNIIHAIATTNAVISGLIVTEALKLIAGCKTALRKTYLMEMPNDYGKMTQTSTLAPANPACMVCSHATVCLSVDTATFTLANLVDRVLKRSMAFNSPSILADDFMYEEGDGLDEDEVAEHTAQLPKALAALPGGGIKHNSQLSVTDQSQDMTVTIVVRHAVLDADEHPEGFSVEGRKPVTAAAPAADVAGPSRPTEEEDDLMVVDDSCVQVVAVAQGRGTKRKNVDDVDPSGPSSSKSARVSDDVIELD